MKEENKKEEYVVKVILKDIIAMSKDIKKLRKSFDENKAQHDNTLDDVKSEIVASETQTESNTKNIGDVKSVQTDWEKLFNEQGLTNVNSRFTNVDSMFSKLEKQTKSNTKNIGDVKSVQTDLEKLFNEQDLTNVNSRFTNVDSKFSRYESQIESNTKKIGDVESSKNFNEIVNGNTNYKLSIVSTILDIDVEHPLISFIYNMLIIAQENINPYKRDVLTVIKSIDLYRLHSFIKQLHDSCFLKYKYNLSNIFLRRCTINLITKNDKMIDDAYKIYLDFHRTIMRIPTIQFERLTESDFAMFNFPYETKELSKEQFIKNLTDIKKLYQ
jgi:hypothetical protein